jgi:hypothetical protein
MAGDLSNVPVRAAELPLGHLLESFIRENLRIRGTNSTMPT